MPVKRPRSQGGVAKSLWLQAESAGLRRRKAKQGKRHGTQYGLCLIWQLLHSSQVDELPGEKVQEKLKKVNDSP